MSRRTQQLIAGAFALVAVLAIGGLTVRNAQLEGEWDNQLRQTQNLERLIDQFDQPGVEHALLARENGSTIAALVMENGQAHIFPIGMQPNSVGKDIYVLWGVEEGANPVALGTFDVADNNGGLLAAGSALGAGKYAAYAISLEPGRKAPAVPTSVVASGTVAV